MRTVNAAFWLLYLLGFWIGAYNRWFLTGSTGQSWGKRKAGIRLVGAATGRPIGGWAAFGRDIAHVVDYLSCYVGFLLPLWDARRQTFADKIAGTVVVEEPDLDSFGLCPRRPRCRRGTGVTFVLPVEPVPEPIRNSRASHYSG